MTVFYIYPINHYNYNIGIYGSTNDVLNKFVKNLKKKYKKINFTYLFSPPFRDLSSEEIKNIQKKINKSNINILFVASFCQPPGKSVLMSP